METPMVFSSRLSRRAMNVTKVLALMAALAVPMFFLNGCMMTPEDKAFYGRGWINPDELDHDQDGPPPAAYNNPTSVQPHMMGPGEY
jgi:hypothetical protein